MFNNNINTKIKFIHRYTYCLTHTLQLA